MDDLPERLLDRPAPEGVRWLALAYLRHLIAARQRLDDPHDSKALHDFRVALRRFRSLVRTYREILDDSVTRRPLGRHATAAGSSRDSEVRLKWLRMHMKIGPANAASIAWVEDELDRDRIKGNRRVQRAVDRNFAPLVDQLQRTLRQFRTTSTLGEVPVVSPTRDVKAEALHTLAIAVEETLEQAHAAGDPELMHRVRIAAKRLRYALEPLVDGKFAPARIQQTAGAAIDQLKRMQDALGELHDELAFDQWLTERIAKSSRPGTRNRATVEGAPENEGETGGPAMRRAQVAFVERLRRRLHRQVERRYHALDGPLWRHRIDRITQRARLVADRLGRKKSTTDSGSMIGSSVLTPPRRSSSTT
jgi:CHAD domain-containing protein